MELGADSARKASMNSEALRTSRARPDTAKTGSDRPLRRARPRILHRPGFRGGADLRDARRRRQADPLRLGRRRRALRRARGALPRRAGSGDRLLDRRVAAARGAAGDQQPDRRGGAKRRGRSWCWRSTATKSRWRTISASLRRLRAAGIASELYLGSGGMNAQLKYADRRRSRVRRHPGLERARRAGRAAGRRSAISSSAPNSPRRPRTAPTISSCASAPSSPRPRRNWSSAFARCSAARSRGRRPRGMPDRAARRPRDICRVLSERDR